jgi:hypothetical protein
MDDAQKERMQTHYQQWKDQYSSNATTATSKKQDFWTGWLLQRFPLLQSSVAFEYPSFAALDWEEGTNNPAVAVVIQHAIHLREAETIQDLKVCIQEQHNHLVEHRPFGPEKDNGGNDCTFLGGFLQWFAVSRRSFDRLIVCSLFKSIADQDCLPSGLIYNMLAWSRCTNSSSGTFGLGTC